MSIIGLLIYLVSLVGFVGTLRSFGVLRYLSWISAMLLQVLILYVMAMFNQLNLGIQLVAFLGCSLFIIRMILLMFNIGRVRFEELHYFDVWMILLGLLLGKVLYASPLIHYDNYSHWALIVKFLTFEGHLPTASDPLISFTSYPPEMALMMTNLVKWVGFSDGTMLLGQFILIWACLYATFAVVRDRTRGLMSFTLCFVITITNVFNIAIRMNNLLVDYVLPVLTAAAIAGVYAYREHPWLQFGHVMLFVNALLLVKNSGGFFVAMIAFYYLYCILKYGQQKWRWRIPRAILATGLGVGVGVLPFMWWQQHVHQTFSGVSKHQISTQAYSKQLSGEDHTVIFKIGKHFVDHILNFGSLSTRGVILINVGLLVGWLVVRWWLHHKNQLLTTLIVLDITFIAYYISLFAMYVVSMPYAEAILLDGLERYMSSIVILSLLLGAMVLLVTMDDCLYEQRIEKRSIRSFSSIFTKNMYQIATFVLMIFSIILMFSEINGIEYNNSIGNNELPVQMRKIARQSKQYNHTKILLVDPHANDVGDNYAGYVGRYYFFSDQVTGQENFMMSAKEFKAVTQQYDYIAIPEWHRTFTVMTNKVYHQHFKTGLYRVTKHKLVKVNHI